MSLSKLDANQIIQSSYDDATGALKTAPVAGALVTEAFDYVSMTLSVGDTVETYIFKSGGASGTTVATVVVTYTTSARTILVSVAKT